MSHLELDASDLLPTRDEFVADALRKAILDGQLIPGQKLDQNEIAKRLNVSRSPIREALRTLAAEGLVEIFSHRSAVVAELSLAELEEIYGIRRVLEGYAARLAAPNVDEERLATLRTTLEECDRDLSRKEWVELNNRFHTTIYEAANQPRLLSMIGTLRNTIAPYIRQYITSLEHLQSSRESHLLIYEACADQDGLAAEQETQRHLTIVAKDALRYVNMDNHK